MICLVLCPCMLCDMLHYVCLILSTKLNVKYPEALNLLLAEKCFKTLTVIGVHALEKKSIDAWCSNVQHNTMLLINISC